METLTFLSFGIPVLGFSQRQILTEAEAGNQAQLVFWKVIPRNTSRKGGGERNTASTVGIVEALWSPGASVELKFQSYFTFDI